MTGANPFIDRSQHLILCGLGHVGERVFALLAALGETIIAINNETPLFWQEMDANPAATLILGDARNERILRQAGVASARAILIVTGDDMTNVSIAVDARKLNPDIRIIIRLFDQDLAEHLESALGIDKVFSTSALATPGFVAAAIGDTTHGSFETGDSIQSIESGAWEPDGGTAVETAAQWQVRTGLALAACKRGADWRTDWVPDMALQAGDQLLYLRQGGKPAARVIPNRSAVRPAFWSGLKQWWRDIPGALRALLLVLLAIVAFSVLLFRQTLGLSFVEAIYFVVTIITTVGFGDYNFMQASPALKLYGAFLMICGAAILATLFSIITDLILNFRLQDLVTRGSSNLRGHIVVAGLGSVGFRVVQELVRRGETVIAIERETHCRFLEPARAWGPVIVGNARLPETLRHAGVAGAKAVLAVTDDDVVNLGIGLAARKANPDSRVVLRLFDAKLAEKLPASLGVRAALSVSGVSAPVLVAAALSADHLHGMQLGDHFLVFFMARHPQAGQPAAPAEPRMILCGRRPGALSFEPLPPGHPLSEMEEWIGVRWYPLHHPHDTPC